jgi:hypothetical protein
MHHHSKRNLVDKTDSSGLKGTIEKLTLCALLLTLGSCPLADSNRKKAVA